METTHIPRLVKVAGQNQRLRREIRVGQHQRAARTVAELRVVDRAAVRRRSNLCEIEVLPDIRVFLDRVEHVRAEQPVIAETDAGKVSILFRAKREAPNRRHLVLRINEVDRASAGERRRRVGVKQRLRNVEAVKSGEHHSIVRECAADAEAGVRVAVRQPDCRVAAGEAADAGADAEIVSCFPVDANARLDQRKVVERCVVRHAETVKHSLVKGRRISHADEVEAETADDGHSRAHGPLILEVEGVERALERRGRIVFFVGRCVGVEDLRRHLRCEIGDRIEHHLTFRKRCEQVEGVEHVALIAEFQQVIAEIVFALRFDVPDAVGEFVGVTEHVRADEQRTTAGGADFELSEISAVKRVLTGYAVSERNAQLGRETIGPIGEQAAGIGFQIFRTAVPV